MGFTFDDTDTKEVATPLAEMRRLLDADPGNAEVIFPYLGGEEINTSPTHSHHRYVINFGERNEEECRRRWPELMGIVETRVKPERITKDAAKYRRMVNEWWKFWNARAELQAAVAGLDRVTATSRITKAFAFTFVPPGTVYNEKTVIFPFRNAAPLANLHSRVHEIWARFFSSTLEDRLQYTPSDCFETFPFPAAWQTHPDLEAAGEAYYDFRAALMVRNDEGLTKTYNRFHDPDERVPEIERLRELHAEMDWAVLVAYGWQDIPTECEFILDYEVDEEELGRKKKPYRYRWPDEVRDEVLARLIELNGERAATEERSGASADGAARASRRRPKRPAAVQAEELF
jgi:hypothetical protein